MRWRTMHFDMIAKMGDLLPADHWLYRRFQKHCRDHFGGLMPVPAIHRKATGNLAAMTVNTTTEGVRVRLIWLESERIDSDPDAASDSLLHEMIHYWLAEKDGDADQQHGPRFCDKAMAIGRCLRLPDVPLLQGSREAIAWPDVHRAAAQMLRNKQKAARKRKRN